MCVYAHVHIHDTYVHVHMCVYNTVCVYVRDLHMHTLYPCILLEVGIVYT